MTDITNKDHEDVISLSFHWGLSDSVAVWLLIVQWYSYLGDLGRSWESLGVNLCHEFYPHWRTEAMVSVREKTIGFVFSGQFLDHPD